MKNSESWKDVLSVYDLKVTPARVAILKLFTRSCQPLDAEHIFTKLKKEGLSQVTVYRTLETLAEKQILRRLDLRQSAVQYELNTDHHHHIVCRGCGIVEEVHTCDLTRDLIRHLKHSHKFAVIDEHSLEFFGWCKECEKNKKSKIIV